MKKIKYLILVLFFMLPFVVKATGDVTVSGNLTLNPGEKGNVVVTGNNVAGVISISSSDTNIITVDKSREFLDISADGSNLVSTINVEVTAVSSGTAKVIVLLEDVATYDAEQLSGQREVSVTVRSSSVVTPTPTPTSGSTIAPTSLVLNKSSLSLKVNGVETLLATIEPNDATDKTLTWSSANNNVATVDIYGSVKAVSVGTTTITVTTSNGIKKECLVTVSNYGGNTPLNPDQEIENVPKTASDMTIVVIIASVILVGFGLFLVLYSKRKNNSNV